MERIHRPGALEEICRNPLEEKQESYQHRTIESPVGPITLIASDVALVSLSWGEDLSEFAAHLRPGHGGKRNPLLTASATQLKEYFIGKRTLFDIPLAPNGTEFQKRVWQQLLKIPYGQYITYGEQARRLGQPKSARAVGAANGKNPIGIIIPCHRVLGASGCLTGFAGGLETKRQLLAIEGVHVSR